MAKRWIISNIVADQDPDLGTFYRMAIQRYPNLHYAFGEIPSDPVTGLPTKTFGFALVASADMARFKDDPEIDVLPDFPLDGKIAAMHGPTKTALKAMLTKHGIASSYADNADGFRDVIRAIGKEINTTFVEDSFDVSEV